MKNEKLKLNFENPDEIKQFIHENDSGIYSGINADGNDVIVLLEKGKGLKTQLLQTNGWCLVHEYDQNGFCEYEGYEK